MDLEKEVEDYWHNSDLSWCRDAYSMTHIRTMLSSIAKHFFELGLNASNPLTWEDMLIIHKCIKDAMNYHLYKMMEGMEGQKIVYQEVLRRFLKERRIV